MRYRRLIGLLFNLNYVVDTHESHPEETTFHHTVQAYQRAKKESDSKELWVAALFHDIGKNIETHGHEQSGVDILRAFGYHNQKVLWLIERHMRIRWMLNGRVKKKGKILEMVNHHWVGDLIHLRRLDGLARTPGLTPVLDREEVNTLLEETVDHYIA
ncbi:MAG: HD domain-containing protein [Desulfobulbaceae bacterium]|nr:HD domain-containing protein [Desulfobulbaceae bacterium]